MDNLKLFDYCYCVGNKIDKMVVDGYTVNDFVFNQALVNWRIAHNMICKNGLLPSFIDYVSSRNLVFERLK